MVRSEHVSLSSTWRHRGIGKWSVVSGQRSVVSGQWSVVRAVLTAHHAARFLDDGELQRGARGGDGAAWQPQRQLDATPAERLLPRLALYTLRTYLRRLGHDGAIRVDDAGGAVELHWLRPRRAHLQP